MFGDLLGRDGLEDGSGFALANVNEHVSVREALERAGLERGLGRGRVLLPIREQALAAEVVLEHLGVRDGHDAVVVEPEPASVDRGLDVHKVVPAVHVARVHEHAVQLVIVRLGTVRLLVQVRLEINLERVLIAVVDLLPAARVSSSSYPNPAASRTLMFWSR